MDSDSQDFYLQWIIADFTPFSFAGRSYFLATPSREARFFAERIYADVYRESLENGLFTDKGIEDLLYKHRLWNTDKQTTLDKLVDDIEEIKLNIFDNYTMSGRRDQFRRALKDTQDYISKLLIDKTAFDMYGAKYVANYARQHFLMGSSIYKKKNVPLLKGEWWLRKEDDIIQHCYKVLSEYSLSESDYRSLARSNQWRNIWSARKAGSLFGRNAVDLSPHQRQLVLWSNTYDSVYKHSSCPSDSIIEDDDALDGWMVKQKRDRDRESNKNLIEGKLTNEKIRNSEQVYIMCDAENAYKVYECNDYEGKQRFHSIMNQVKKEGTVSIMGLKDTQREIYRRAAELKGG